MLRWPIVALGVAAVHAAVTIALTVVVFGSNMSRWDTDSPAPLSIVAADFALSILALPLLPLFARLPRGAIPSGFPWDHLLFLVNGLSWGIAAVGLLHVWRARSSQRGSL